MRIAIVGAGYVGLTSASVMAKLGHTVWLVEKDAKKVAKLARGQLTFYEPGLAALLRDAHKKHRIFVTKNFKEAIPEAEIVMLCVGTPPLPTGAPNLKAVEASAASVAQHLKKHTVIAIKSTVPVGTAINIRKLMEKYTSVPFDMASCPEFLREGSAVEDTLHPARIVIGTDSARARKILLALHKKFSGERVLTDLRTAELIKYASNAFLATKISFSNEMANLCEEVGANIDDVARGMGLDPRIGTSFLKAGIGYGGSCFPKDTRALYSLADAHAYNFKLLKAVIEVNKTQREHFIEKVTRALGTVRGKRIGVLGLAFKNNTDDVRESASLEIIAALMKKGVRVTAFDPKAGDNAKLALPSLALAKNPLAVAHRAHALLILTEWPEFRLLNWQRIKKKMQSPLIIDGRNLLNPKAMRKAGFTYLSIGRPEV